MGFGFWEISLVLLVVLIIFGVGKLPEIGSGLGKGILNFKKSIKDEDEGADTPKIEENGTSNKN